MTHYEVLSIAPSASADELHVRFKELALKHHPDKGGDRTTFTAVTEAYAVLKDTKRRAAYDAELKLLRMPCSKCAGEGRVYVTGKNFTKTAKTCPKCEGVGYL